VSSGTACQQGQARGSAVLAAMGYSPEQASSGVRLSLGPWLSDQDLAAVPAAFERAQQAMATDFSR